MHALPRPLLLSLVVLAAGLAGCAGGGGDGDESQDTNGTNGTGGTNGTPLVTPPTTTTSGTRAHFQVSEIVILPGDEKARPLYEDDEKAIIRYTVSQPADAPGAETAFVSYILNGRILDAQQITLTPGQERDYERTVSGLRENRTIKVEVRAGSSSSRNETTVESWPRAGSGSLEVGSIDVRADYGLLEQDGRVLVNLTLVNDGTEEVEDFRMKMLCVDGAGEVQTTKSYDVAAPTPGNRTGVDVLIDDCPTGSTRYGLELKGKDSTGDLWGRLLLVPEDWTPGAAPTAPTA